MRHTITSAAFVSAVLFAFGVYMLLSGLFEVPLRSRSAAARGWSWFRLDAVGRSIWIGAGAVLVSSAVLILMKR